jgi:large subunit ribosomal protein L17
MRHRHKGRKLNRTWSHKKAMLRNMVTTFFELEQIETTDAKAKEVRSLAERLITLGKRGGDDLAARRQAMKVIRSKKVVAKLFDELAPRYADRPGGYTRIVKVDDRRGDGAQLSILQLIAEPVTFKDMKHKRARQEEEARRAEEVKRGEKAEREDEVKGEEAQPEVEETSEEAAKEDVEETAEEPATEPEAEAEPETEATAEEPPAEGEPEAPEPKEA